MSAEDRDELDALQRKAAAAMSRLRALGADQVPPADALEPLREELLSLARRQLAAGDGPSAAVVLDALLDSLAPSHPQREEVARLAARARGARPRKDGVRSVSLSDLERKGFRQVKVLRAGEINELISRAVTRALGRPRVSAGVDEQERDRIVSDARAELDRRMQAIQETVEAGDVDDPDDEAVIDPALSAGYLLMAAQDGELTPEETASLEDRLGAADPVLRVEWAWLERGRGALGRVATFVPADDDAVWDRLRAGVRARLDERPPRLEPALDDIEQARRRLDAKLAETNRQLTAEKQALLRERAALRESLTVATGPSFLRRGSIEVASVHVPAAGEPNGDLVDVAERAGGVDVLIGDVSGRGAASVLGAAATRAAVHAALALGAEPSAALAAANRGLKRTLATGMFVAASLVRWDEARGRAVIAGAGHEDVIIYRAGGGRVERLKPGGVVLGVVEAPPPFAPREVELAPGDALVLVSDGVTEASGPGGEPFCDPAWTRLLAVVAARGQLDAPDLVGAVRDAVRAWGEQGEQAPDDDLVVVALRRTPATPPPSTKAAMVASMLGLDAFF